MSLLYKRIIEEIGDQHSELLERLLKEFLPDNNYGISPNSPFVIISTLCYGPSTLTQYQKEEIERRIIEAVDNGMADEELVANVRLWKKEFTGDSDDPGSSQPK